MPSDAPQRPEPSAPGAATSRPGTELVISRRSIAGVVALAFIAGVLLTALPLLSSTSPLWDILAWPGIVFSGLCGANDKWGLPDLRLYLVGGTLSWAVFLVLMSALAVSLRHRRRSAS